MASDTNGSTSPTTSTAAAATSGGGRPPHPWPLVVIAAGAFVALWGGWVKLGELTGFGLVRLLPGIADSVELNTAITLPLTIEAYAGYALKVWVSKAPLTSRTRSFAKWSVIAGLFIGWCAQGASHLMTAGGITRAPWLVTVLVAGVPVLAIGLAAGLYQLVRQDTRATTSQTTTSRTSPATGGGELVEVGGTPPAEPPELVDAATSEPSTPPEQVPVPRDAPALADRLAVVIEHDKPHGGRHRRLAIDLPPEVLARADELITTSEQHGKRIGRPALMEELGIGENAARRLLAAHKRRQLHHRPDPTSADQQSASLDDQGAASA